LKWDAVGSILKQTKRKHQLTIKNRALKLKVTLLLVRWVIAYVLAFLWFINSILELSPKMIL
jgi:hypothetical protein